MPASLIAFARTARVSFLTRLKPTKEIITIEFKVCMNLSLKILQSRSWNFSRKWFITNKRCSNLNGTRTLRFLTTTRLFLNRSSMAKSHRLQDLTCTISLKFTTKTNTNIWLCLLCLSIISPKCKANSQPISLHIFSVLTKDQVLLSQKKKMRATLRRCSRWLTLINSKKWASCLKKSRVRPIKM